MNNLPATSAALILHVGGTVEMHLPKQDADDNVPVNVQLISILGVKIQDAEFRMWLMHELEKLVNARQN